jgi:hypothetical protein
MDIKNVLDLIKNKIEKLDPIEDRFLVSNGNNNGFEKLFPVIAKQVQEEISSSDKLEITENYGHYFPDIDLMLNGKKYGVELKFRKDGSWSTLGNSVLSTLTTDDYNEVYLVFASKPRNEKKIYIKYDLYWKTTSSIQVTHSPRYTINMDDSDTVFESSEEYTTYKNKSEDEKIEFIQSLLRKSVSGTKWYTAPEKIITGTQFKYLECEEKKQLLAEAFLLYPFDLFLGSNQLKYKRVTDYYINTHFIYDSGLRDHFTSSGKATFNGVEFPKMIKTLESVSEIIVKNIEEASPDFKALMIDNWEESFDKSLISDDLLNSYKKILNLIGDSDKIPVDGNGPYRELLEKAEISTLSELIFGS